VRSLPSAPKFACTSPNTARYEPSAPCVGAMPAKNGSSTSPSEARSTPSAASATSYFPAAPASAGGSRRRATRRSFVPRSARSRQRPNPSHGHAQQERQGRRYSAQRSAQPQVPACLGHSEARGVSTVVDSTPAREPAGHLPLAAVAVLETHAITPVSAACSRDAFGDPADSRWEPRDFADPPHDGGAFVGDGACCVVLLYPQCVGGQRTMLEPDRPATCSRMGPFSDRCACSCSFRRSGGRAQCPSPIALCGTASRPPGCSGQGSVSSRPRMQWCRGRRSAIFMPPQTRCRVERWSLSPWSRLGRVSCR